MPARIAAHRATNGPVCRVVSFAVVALSVLGITTTWIGARCTARPVGQHPGYVLHAQRAQAEREDIDVWGTVFDDVSSRPRLLVVSIGGIGTSSLMTILSTELGKMNVEMNDVNDGDGLKHAPFGPPSRGAVAAFDPTAILYILGNPAAGLLSHYRRGWADSQLCKLRPDDSNAILAGDPSLRAAVVNCSGVDCFLQYANIVAARAAAVTAAHGAPGEALDAFRVWEHAQSWVAAAAALHRPVIFASIETAVAVQGSLVRLLGLPPDARPLARFEILRPTSRVPQDRIPPSFTALYAGIHARLLDELDGRCAGGEGVCAESSLALVKAKGDGDADVPPDTLGFARVNARLSQRSIAHAWARRVALMPGICGAVLRPQWRRINSDAATGGAAGAARSFEEQEELVQAQPAFIAHAQREREAAARRQGQGRPPGWHASTRSGTASAPS